MNQTNKFYNGNQKLLDSSLKKKPFNFIYCEENSLMAFELKSFKTMEKFENELMSGGNYENIQKHLVPLTITFDICKITMHHIGEIHKISTSCKPKEDKHYDRYVGSAQ